MRSPVVLAAVLLTPVDSKSQGAILHFFDARARSLLFESLYSASGQEVRDADV